MTDDVRIRVRGASVSIGETEVLSDVDLDVRAGEWLTVVGPNASGKTTLLRCLAGQIAHRRGQVEHSGAARGARVGFACAPDRLPPLLTGWQCLQVYWAARGLVSIDDDVLALGERLGFAPFAGQLVETYSLGTRQKLAVLLSLAGAPDVLLLDEVFNGLDPASAQILKRHLRERVEQRRLAVVLATHALDIASRHADRVALIVEGRLRRLWAGAELDALRDGDALAEAMAAAVT